MTLVLPRITTYSGAKSLSVSTPIFDLGRSLMWPTDAFTSKDGPRYFFSVRALAGDSTTRSDRVRFALVAGVDGAFFLADAFFSFAAGSFVSFVPGSLLTFSAAGGFFAAVFFL